MGIFRLYRLLVQFSGICALCSAFASTRPCKPQRTSLVSTYASTTNVVQNQTMWLVQDDHGKVNRLLAERLWSWEQTSREKEQLPPLDYSVRSGLRLVESLVQELIPDEATGSELEQEGLIALIDAMQTYRNQDLNFESHCRDVIRERLRSFQAQQQRPMVVPLQLVRQARLVRRALQRRHSRQQISWQQVAGELDVEWPVLEAALRSSGARVVSTESTVQVNSNPDQVSYTNQDKWEGEHEDVEEFWDADVAYEGDDEAWIRQREEAEPLADSIVDHDDDSNDDDLRLMMIQSDVKVFLESVLEPLQVQAVRIYFGLDDAADDNTNRIERIRKELNLEGASEAQGLLQGAMRQLRDSYTSTYMNENFDEMDSL